MRPPRQICHAGLGPPHTSSRASGSPGRGPPDGRDRPVDRVGARGRPPARHDQSDRIN